MEEIRRQHEEDLKNKGGYVKLPSALAGNIPGPHGNGAGNECFLRTARTRKSLRICFDLIHGMDWILAHLHLKYLMFSRRSLHMTL